MHLVTSLHAKLPDSCALDRERAFALTPQSYLINDENVFQLLGREYLGKYGALVSREYEHCAADDQNRRISIDGRCYRRVKLDFHQYFDASPDRKRLFVRYGAGVKVLSPMPACRTRYEILCQMGRLAPQGMRLCVEGSTLFAEHGLLLAEKPAADFDLLLLGQSGGEQRALDRYWNAVMSLPGIFTVDATQALRDQILERRRPYYHMPDSRILFHERRKLQGWWQNGRASSLVKFVIRPILGETLGMIERDLSGPVVEFTGMVTDRGVLNAIPCKFEVRVDSTYTHLGRSALVRTDVGNFTNHVRPGERVFVRGRCTSANREFLEVDISLCDTTATERMTIFTVESAK